VKRIAWVAIVIGCAGKAPPQPATSADAGTGGGDADAPLGSDATELAVSGNVSDYFTGNLLDTTIVQSDGLDPAVNTTDAADGSYSLQVATGSKLYLVTSRANYLTTRNAITAVAGSDVIQNVFVLAETDVQRQYSSVGSAENGADGYIEVQLEKNDGTPLTGIATTAIVLTDETGSAVPVSTYFAGAVGDLDTTVTTSTAEGSNGARAGLINVPKGQYSLAVTYTNGMGNPNTNYTPVVVDGGAATLVISGGLGQPSTAPIPTQPSFATDIYPRLQTAANGGLGCANCHTATGPAGANGLPYDGTSAATFTLVTTTAGVVVLATPATSLILTNPLYSVTPHNHPNATFLDVNDPDYKLFLAWITAGAKP
jgi:hypothetical protein